MFKKLFIVVFVISINACAGKMYNLEGIPSSYSLPNFEKQNIQINQLRNGFSGGVPGGIYASENATEIMPDGYYSFHGVNTKIYPPYLETGKLNIHHAFYDNDEQVRFFDAEDNKWVGTAIVTRLAETDQNDPERVKAAVTSFVNNFAEKLHAMGARYILHRVQIGGNEVIELIVLNRQYSQFYPKADIKVENTSKVWSVGINRYLILKDQIIELGLIVPINEKLKSDEFTLYAIEKMNRFMSGLKI